MRTLKKNINLSASLKVLFVALLVGFSNLLMADSKDTLEETASYTAEMQLLDIYFPEESLLLPVEAKPKRIEVYNQQDELVYTYEGTDSQKDVTLNNLLNGSEFLMQINNTYYYQLANDRYLAAH